MRRFATIILAGLAASAATRDATARQIRVPFDQPTIQAGIDSAASGDTVKVAPGIYTGAGNRDMHLSDKAVVVRSLAGSSQTTIDVQGAGVPALTILDTYPLPSGSLEGFRITGATDGIVILEGNPLLRDITFSGNSGQGVHIFRASAPAQAVLIDCVFLGNGILGDGPRETSFQAQNCHFENIPTAITANRPGGYPYGITIKDSEFIGNVIAIAKSSDFYDSAASLIIDNSTFEGNQTAIVGACTLTNSVITNGVNGIRLSTLEYMDQRAELYHSTFSHLTGTAIVCGYDTKISDCHFDSNPGSVVGGGGTHNFVRFSMSRCSLHNNGGGVSLLAYILKANIDSCDFAFNGAGVSLTEDNAGVSSESVNSCTFEYSGGIHISIKFVGGTHAIRGCTFTKSTGAAITCDAAYAINSDAAWQITGNTITENSGDGVRLSYGGRISNCIIDHNDGAGIWVGPGPAPVLEANDVYSNNEGNYAGVPNQTGLNGNISVNPLYCDSQARNFTLREDSPCAPGNTGYGLIGAHGVGCGPTTGVSDPAAIAGGVVLRQNQPNPVVGSTEISFSLLSPSDVAIDLFDLAGKRVMSLARGDMEAGQHTVTWNGQDEEGHRVAAGLYFYRLQAGSVNVSGRLVKN